MIEIVSLVDDKKETARRRYNLKTILGTSRFNK